MNEETHKTEEIHTNEDISVDKAALDGNEAHNSLEAKNSKQSKKNAKKKPKKKGRFSWSTFILVLIMLAGAGVFLYPSISDWWNSMHATQAIAGYVAAVEDMSAEEKEKMFEEAKAYNESLPNGVNFNLLHGMRVS